MANEVTPLAHIERSEPLEVWPDLGGEITLVREKPFALWRWTPPGGRILHVGTDWLYDGTRTYYWLPARATWVVERFTNGTGVLPRGTTLGAVSPDVVPDRIRRILPRRARALTALQAARDLLRRR